jgi:hypothetical protein
MENEGVIKRVRRGGEREVRERREGIIVIILKFRTCGIHECTI